MSETMQTFVISYETSQATWKLYLLATGKEDAMSFLQERVGSADGFRINNFDSREEIHAVTPTVLDKLKGPPEVVIESRYICPWCGSTEFSNDKGLRTHITMVHTKKKPKKEKKEK